MDIAAGRTECLPLLTRDGSLVVEAMQRAQGLFPWVLVGADFDNDSVFRRCRCAVVPGREDRGDAVASLQKNDPAFVGQKMAQSSAVSSVRPLRGRRGGRGDSHV